MARQIAKTTDSTGSPENTIAAKAGGGIEKQGDSANFVNTVGKIGRLRMRENIHALVQDTHHGHHAH